MQVLNQCKKFCLPIIYQSLLKLAFLNNSIEFCETAIDSTCMYTNLWKLLANASKNCSTSCTRTQYIGRVQKTQHIFPKNGIELLWRFDSTDILINQEYLIYDVIGMIGSIGGLLGLFIGFSFKDFLFYFIDRIFHLNLMCKTKKQKQMKKKKKKKKKSTKNKHRIEIETMREIIFT